MMTHRDLLAGYRCLALFAGLQTFALISGLGLPAAAAGQENGGTRRPSLRDGARRPTVQETVHLTEQAFFDGVGKAGEPVMDAARKRIEDIRKGDFAVTLTDEQGKPLKGTARVRLLSHAFAFGAHFSGFLKGDQHTPLADNVLKAVDELFNTVVVTGYWKMVEPQAGQFDWQETDRLLRWAQEHHKNTRFHCIIYSFPKWAKSANTEQAWWKTFEARIKSVAERYGRTIKEYDVINEMVSDKIAWPAKKEEIESYKGFPCLWEPTNGARILSIARKYLPDAKLVVLETGISTPANSRFLATVAYDKALAELGAPFDYCGHQAHFYINGAMPFREGHPEAGPGAFTMSQLSGGLDLLAAVGKPVVITEFNPPSREGKSAKGRAQGGLTQEELAAWTVNYTTLVFSKPYIRGLSRWFVTDGGRGADAGILTEKGEKKPVYFALRRLLKETWNTDWSGPIRDGQACFRGYYGTYEILVDGYAPAQVACDSDGRHAEVGMQRRP